MSEQETTQEPFKAETTTTQAETTTISEEPKGFQFPITVTSLDFKINMGFQKDLFFSSKDPGTWVAIRPCGDEYGNKTYLGIFLGSIPLTAYVTMDKAGKMTFHTSMINPAIWVPDLKKVIMGCASFWGTIKSPEDMRKITDADIQNVWYVKALKDLAEKADKEKIKGG